MKLYTCLVCGRPSEQRRCRDHRLPRRARGRAFEATRQRIAARDRWVCQLCFEPIDPTLRKPNPRALTIHHRRGRVAGDSDDNLCAAHAECNLTEGEPT